MTSKDSKEDLKTDSKGYANYTFYDDVIRLKGTKYNIIGRGLIIHADPDDCGEGGMPDSLTTGHAGKRIACAVIGYAKENFDDNKTIVNDRYVYKNTECNLS